MIGKISVAVFLSLALAAAAPAQDLGIAVGAQAPNAMLHTLDGRKVNLSDYMGKTPVVIEFWATWCPLCKELEPQIVAAKEKFSERITFIGITVPENQTPARAMDFVTRNSMKGTFLFDTDGLAYKAFSAPHTSYLVVIDKGGKVVYTGVGGKQDVAAAIGKLGPLPPSDGDMPRGGAPYNN
jgi:thiol-disulfide isomerase/thioredoxin